MERIYEYKGFQVTVGLEIVWDASRRRILLPPRGYVAVIRISAEREHKATILLKRLSAEGSKPFATEGDALMAGYSEAQRLIDYVIIQ